MAEKNTIARPYAEAVFELARDTKSLAAWSQMLGGLALIVSDARVQELIGNPRVADEQLCEFLFGVAGDRLTPEAKNFIKVMIDNGRLGVLPEVVGLYESYRAREERTVDAEVISAFPVSEKQKAQLGVALKARLSKEVRLTCRTDKALIGGAIIRAGDLVIDGSARGQLAKLASALSH